MQQLNRGVLITIEGIDGSGKSTLASNIYTYLMEQQFPVILTKEPGGSALGKQLREILQTQTRPLSAKAEYLLFAADRAEHFQKIISPSLQQHAIIISDRSSDSSLVYQGYGRGLEVDMIDQVNGWAKNGLCPDLTFYINVSPECAQKRLEARNIALTSFEQEDMSFTKRLIHGFSEIFKNRKNVIVLDGKQSADTLKQQTIDYVLSWIEKNHLRVS
jgi:dTMP kinase